ncbi:MAG: hypothetical protein JWM34_1481 [Ilumatobacteraceae bacterium]|nr:hypothetical protein [Ilumatobacteraceae bacterium]
MQRTTSTSTLWLTAVISVASLAGCSSDSTTTSTSTVVTAASSTPVDSVVDTTSASGDATADSGTGTSTAAVTSITGQQLCDLVPSHLVEAALGIEVTTEIPSTADTPQCAYVFTDKSGSTDNVTIAYERPGADLNGGSGDAGFDYITSVNRTIAAGTDATETSVDAGDKAETMVGSQLSLGVVEADGQIFVTIVPAGTSDAAGAAALLKAVATAVG